MKLKEWLHVIASFIIAIAIMLILACGGDYLSEKYQHSQSYIEDHKNDGKIVKYKHETFFSYYLISEDNEIVSVPLNIYMSTNVGDKFYSSQWH